MAAAGYPGPVAWELIDAEQRAEHEPGFVIADRGVREGRGVGDRVQLGFAPVPRPSAGPAAERMWVGISATLPGGRFRGDLLNEPRRIAGLAYGDQVEFGPENIFTIEI